MTNSICKNKSEVVPAILFSLILFGMLLRDLALKNYLGTIAQSPMVFISPVIFFILLLRQKKIIVSTLAKYYLYYVVISIITALLMMLITVFFVTKGGFYIYTEYFPFKLIRASVYNIVYFLTVYNLIVLLHYLSINTVCRILEAVVYMLIVYGLLQQFLHFSIPIVNSSEIEETRIALTAAEPSDAAPLFLTISTTVIALRFYLNKNKQGSFIIAVLAFAMLVFIGSKGALLLIPLALVITIRKRLNFRVILGSLILIIPLIIVIVNNVVPLLTKDISNFNSFSTRVTTLVAAGKSLFWYPLGEGYGTYLVYYPPMLLPTNNEIINFTGLPLLNIELSDMVETGKNLPAKSGIANEIVYNGITALVFVYFVSRYYVKKTKLIADNTSKLLFSFLGVLLLIIFMFSSILETAYFYLLPLVIVPMLSESKQHVQSI